VYAPIGYLLLAVDPALAVPGGAGAVGVARLPDYDLRVPFLEHRGVTHTLLFLGLVAAVLGGVGYAVAGGFGTDPVRTAGLGGVVAAVAVGSHLLVDALTPAGVPLLWPLSDETYSIDLATASIPGRQLRPAPGGRLCPSRGRLPRRTGLSAVETGPLLAPGPASRRRYLS